MKVFFVLYGFQTIIVQMAGIYIHIPFCTKACNYCDFHFSTSLKLKNDIVSAIQQELINRVNYVSDEKIETIYFGGGTPSLLNKDELSSILKTIYTSYSVSSDPEITLEANPDDLTKSKLKELKEAGVNRLSIGVQSFKQEHLTWMNRSHDVEQAKQSIKLARAVGFTDLSVDLIYGIPAMDIEVWEENISELIALNPTHISSYCLTAEHKTALQYAVDKGEVTMPLDRDTSEQFNVLVYMLREAGYEQYEISNFCKEGLESKHNSSYWLGKKYLGVGPSAHSFNGESRRWNVSNNAKYLKAIADDTIYWEDEVIDVITSYNEYVLTRLRTKWGIEKTYLEKHFPAEILSHFNKEVYFFLKNGLVVLDNEESYVLSDAGKLLADGIASDLFFIEED